MLRTIAIVLAGSLNIVNATAMILGEALRQTRHTREKKDTEQ